MHVVCSGYLQAKPGLISLHALLGKHILGHGRGHGFGSVHHLRTRRCLASRQPVAGSLHLQFRLHGNCPNMRRMSFGNLQEHHGERRMHFLRGQHLFDNSCRDGIIDVPFLRCERSVTFRKRVRHDVRLQRRVHRDGRVLLAVRCGELQAHLGE